ncbi:alpha/beta fold hydrolase [Aquimarina spongiae]|uniref:Pimeloyl-ACP methyl ester carboxylesterase n=1 Tax=Aquimarina spongiae TaxID=570521 RepID=A0A1M6HC89_9FLAO|nr:alpha/beta hydrolase [Aquimarina spongiae]SHJ19709.1 Pimeloyl-ACP methyl ester carboxylesterase [Aquimarina spongiae]
MKTNRQHSKLLKTRNVQLQKLGLNIRYAELGNPVNPTVLLLHGVPENLYAWYDIAPVLARNYHVLAIDWPGFGGSEAFTDMKNHNPRSFANVGMDFLNTLQIIKAQVMATDIGLSPALIMGVENPDRIGHIVVMDGIPFPTSAYSSWELKSFAQKNSIRAKALIKWFPKISAKIAYNKGFYKGSNIPKEVQAEFLKDGYNKTTQNAFLSYFQNNAPGQTYLESRIHEIQQPVLVVWGKHDRFINAKLGELLAQKLTNAQLEIIDDSGHFVHMDQPQKLLKITNDFLALETLKRGE